MAPLGTPASTTGPLKHPKNPRWRAGSMDGTPGTLNCSLGIPLSPWEHQLGPQELLQHPRDTRQHSRNPCSILGTLDGTLGNLAARLELLQHPRIPAPPHAHRDLAPLGTLCQHPATSRAQCQHTVRTLDPSDLCQHPVCVGTLCWHPAPMGTLGDTEPSGTLLPPCWETLCQHPGGHSTHEDPMPAPLGTQCLQEIHASISGDTTPMGTFCQTQGALGTISDPCGNLTPHQEVPTATHLREVTGQPVPMAGAHGGAQGEVEGTELAGPHGARGDVELTSSTVPQGHAAAGELGGQRGELCSSPQPPQTPPIPMTLPC